jgi:predicted benzoate:H+ symporter BenE
MTSNTELIALARSVWTLLSAMAAGSFLTQLLSLPTVVPRWLLAIALLATASNSFAVIFQALRARAV